MNNISILIKNKLLIFSRFSKRKQFVIYFLIFITLLILISGIYFSSYQFYQQQLSFKQKLMTQLNHQQKIITTLKEKAQKRLMTPKVAKQLLPINQKIEELLLPSLSLLSSKWEMASAPLLTLNIEGDFLALRYFIFQMLQQNPQLHLVKCQIAKGSLRFDDIEIDGKESQGWEDIRDVKEIQKQQGKIQSELLFKLNLFVTN